MSNISEKLDQLSPLQRAIYALKTTRAKLDTIEQQRTEPIAIIGMGCRFPGGANDPDAFWQMLYNGFDAIREVPSDRWDLEAYYSSDSNVPGKMYTRQGNFLDIGVDQFDAEFFGLSPREVVSMDPQQRLLLEVSWEALENAGQASGNLNGSQTGVFIGMTTNDYAQRAMFAEVGDIDIYTATGNALNVAAGRLSYTFGLHGPSMVIDTACSSSLVAVHLACQNLRAGECNMALAGGVNLILSPEVTIAMSKLRALSTDGRCKTFAATADGYGRGEGCGIIVLKRLSDAIVDNDNILAIIRGSAVNQDGHSSGLTVPNGLAQQAVIRAALVNAKIEPNQISYVEAHGTGTTLGDPIELKSLAQVLGQNRLDPLIVGSVKTNIGHLEAAAGIASLIKVVLAMQHKTIPAHLHLEELNQHISEQNIPVIIPTQLTPWLAADIGKDSSSPKRVAGISSFSFSGTNAHVVVEEAPVRKPTEVTVDRPIHILTLKAKSSTALISLAARFEKYLKTHSLVSLADFCFTANTGRSYFEYNLALIAESQEHLCQQLAKIVTHKQSFNKLPSTGKHKIVFMFTGQGSQYMGMGRQLYESQPTFRKTLDYCDQLLQPLLGKSILSVLYPDPGIDSPINETVYTQPILFALEYALAKLWQSWGIEPTAVMGHSVGEYVAACVAGVFSLDDGLKLIAHRAQLMQTLPACGKMVAIFASETQVAAAIASLDNRVSIAAINGPKNTVISGHQDAVQTVIKHLEAEGVEYKPLSVSHAFHSPLIEPILEDFERIAKEVQYSTPLVLLISNLTGKPVAGTEIACAEYWKRHVREAVKFSESIQTLHEQDYQLFVEIGPHPVLIGMGKGCLPQGAGIWLPSLKREKENWQQILQSLITLYEQGIDVDWRGFDQDYQRHRLSLPTYPFERQRYWKDTISKPLRTGRILQNLSHPLLDQLLPSPLPQIQFESQFKLDSLPLVRDHQLYGIPLVNFVIYLEMAMAGAKAVFGKKAVIFENVFISQALTLSHDEIRHVQLILEPEHSGKAAFRIFSQKKSTVVTSEPWKLHTTGQMSFEQSELAYTTETFTSLEALQAQCQKEISSAEFYQMMRDRDANLGPSCQWLEQVWRGNGEAFGKIRMPKTEEETYTAYHLPLGAIDACFQLLAASLLDTEKDYMLVAVEKFYFYGTSEQLFWGHAIIKLEEYNNAIVGNVCVFDDTGRPIIKVLNAQLKQVNREVVQRATQVNNHIHEQSSDDQTILNITLYREQILTLETEEAQSLLEKYLLEILAKALQIPVSRLQPQQLLFSLVDSLIIVEMKNQIETDLQVNVPATKFLEETSIQQLATFILNHLNPKAATLLSNFEHIDDEILAQTLAELEILSEAEAQSMLTVDTRQV